MLGYDSHCVCARVWQSFGAYLMQEWTTDSKSSKHPAPPYIWLVVGFGAAAFVANLLGACGACCRNMCLLSWGASISETILFWQVRHGQS
jgi:hypothetical protein